MVESIRKTGIITKGIIYALVGILTFLAAVSMGGEVAGKSEVINFLKQQTFGQFLLYGIAAGLAMYALWRLYSAFFDGKNKGSDKKGILQRTGYFFSGLIYGFLAISIFANSSNGNSKQSYVSELIRTDGGVILLYIIGIILFCVGAYQFYKGYSGKFLEEIKERGKIKFKSGKLLKKTGKYGLMSRGVAFAIFAFFVFVAASQKNAQAVKGLEGMFNFLQDFTLGNILMGLMALGLLLYGVYQYFLAKYSSVYN